MKHFAVKEELFLKVMKHLSRKEIKVFTGAWVEKACEDRIKREKEWKIIRYTHSKNAIIWQVNFLNI